MASAVVVRMKVQTTDPRANLSDRGAAFRISQPTDSTPLLLAFGASHQAHFH
jgi:hypothetical protein